MTAPPRAHHGNQPRLRVDPIACTAHGLCAELLPEHITLDEWGSPHRAQPDPHRATATSPPRGSSLPSARPTATPT
jgi:ferredoxin